MLRRLPQLFCAARNIRRGPALIYLKKRDLHAENFRWEDNDVQSPLGDSDSSSYRSGGSPLSCTANKYTTCTKSVFNERQSACDRAGGAERDAMWQGINKFQRALTQAGFAPR